MFLNTIKPAKGAKKDAVRVGRGIGCGMGKTCGRGHKGQRARAGGFHKVGFEGGQMPMQRRLPKFGFNSHLAKTVAVIRLSDLALVTAEGEIDMDILKQAGLVARNARMVRVIKSGELTKAVTLRGIHATAGAKQIIEAQGGKVTD